MSDPDTIRQALALIRGASALAVPGSTDSQLAVAREELTKAADLLRTLASESGPGDEAAAHGLRSYEGRMRCVPVR